MKKLTSFDGVQEEINKPKDLAQGRPDPTQYCHQLPTTTTSANRRQRQPWFEIPLPLGLQCLGLKCQPAPRVSIPCHAHTSSLPVALQELAFLWFLFLLTPLQPSFLDSLTHTWFLVLVIDTLSAYLLAVWFFFVFGATIWWLPGFSQPSLTLTHAHSLPLPPVLLLALDFAPWGVIARAVELKTSASR